MDELLAKATQGVDMDAPDAFWRIFGNLMSLIPWVSLFWWSVLFVLVGALLGWWRGRTLEGIVLAALLGPIGWIVVLRPRPKPKPLPPPLPPRR